MCRSSCDFIGHKTLMAPLNQPSSSFTAADLWPEVLTRTTAFVVVSQLPATRPSYPSTTASRRRHGFQPACKTQPLPLTGSRQMLAISTSIQTGLPSPENRRVRFWPPCAAMATSTSIFVRRPSFFSARLSISQRHSHRVSNMATAISSTGQPFCATSRTAWGLVLERNTCQRHSGTGISPARQRPSSSRLDVIPSATKHPITRHCCGTRAYRSGTCIILEWFIPSMVFPHSCRRPTLHWGTLAESWPPFWADPYG